MRFGVAFRIAGAINLILACFMLPPLLVSLLYNEGDAWIFLLSILVAAGSGGLLFFAFRGQGAGTEVGHREGFLVVALAWVSASLSSAVPFSLSGHFPSFVDALFEAVSGITTTGASVLVDIEALSHAMLLWRSLIHWLGGMGIVLLGLAILPILGIGGMQLYKAEASTVSADKFVPRIKEMVRIILAVYLLLSFTLFTLFLLGGMGVFDAFVHMVGTVGTAGFSDKNLSVGHFGSAYVEMVIILFMIIGATNFALHFRLFQQGPRVYARNEEFRFLLLILLVATVLVTINLSNEVYPSVGTALRYAAFQVTSITTTTGFSSADFAAWPAFSQIILFSLMFVGGSAGSTAGSIKCIRVLLLLKVAYKEVYRLVHPHAVIPIKLGGRVVAPEVISGVMGYTVIFFSVFVASSIFLAALGLDPVTAISSAAATITNVGPGLGQTGPMGNYSVIPTPGKWVLILNMLLGRLEIYTLFVLFTPAFWRG